MCAHTQQQYMKQWTRFDARWTGIHRGKCKLAPKGPSDIRIRAEIDSANSQADPHDDDGQKYSAANGFRVNPTRRRDLRTPDYNYASRTLNKSRKKQSSPSHMTRQSRTFVREMSRSHRFRMRCNGTRGVSVSRAHRLKRCLGSHISGVLSTVESNEGRLLRQLWSILLL
jgi:hypothetical protein